MDETERGLPNLSRFESSSVELEYMKIISAHLQLQNVTPASALANVINLAEDNVSSENKAN